MHHPLTHTPTTHHSPPRSTPQHHPIHRHHKPPHPHRCTKPPQLPRPHPPRGTPHTPHRTTIKPALHPHHRHTTSSPRHSTLHKPVPLLMQPQHQGGHTTGPVLPHKAQKPLPHTLLKHPLHPRQVPHPRGTALRHPHQPITGSHPISGHHKAPQLTRLKTHRPRHNTPQSHRQQNNPSLQDGTKPHRKHGGATQRRLGRPLPHPSHQHTPSPHTRQRPVHTLAHTLTRPNLHRPNTLRCPHRPRLTRHPKLLILKLQQLIDNITGAIKLLPKITSSRPLPRPLANKTKHNPHTLGRLTLKPQRLKNTPVTIPRPPPLRHTIHKRPQTTHPCHRKNPFHKPVSLTKPG